MKDKPLGHIIGYIILLVYGAFVPIWHTITTDNLVTPPYELLLVVMIIILGKDGRNLMREGKFPFGNNKK